MPIDAIKIVQISDGCGAESDGIVEGGRRAGDGGDVGKRGDREVGCVEFGKVHKHDRFQIGRNQKYGEQNRGVFGC